MKKFIPSLLLLLTPLFFLPITFNFFTVNKLALIIVVTIGLLVYTAVEHIFYKRHSHQTSFFTLSLLLFEVAIITNLLLTKEGQVESFISRGFLFNHLTHN
jgi:hypothetical protein